MKKSSLNKVSKKRAKANAVYARKKKEYLDENPICKVCNCHFSTTIHHKLGRIGPLLTDETYFLGACFTCHRLIEDNKTWAKQMGYSLDRLAI